MNRIKDLVIQFCKFGAVGGLCFGIDYGRSDVVVYDSLNGRVAVFEAKYAKSLNDLDTACEKAVQQMDDLMYAKSFEDDYDEVICYGISFYKKRCVVKKK